jgi:hypothetical protein
MYDTSVVQGGQTKFVRPTWSFEANVPQLTNLFEIVYDMTEDKL